MIPSTNAPSSRAYVFVRALAATIQRSPEVAGAVAAVGALAATPLAIALAIWMNQQNWGGPWRSAESLGSWMSSIVPIWVIWFATIPRARIAVAISLILTSAITSAFHLSGDELYSIVAEVVRGIGLGLAIPVAFAITARGRINWRTAIRFAATMPFVLAATLLVAMALTYIIMVNFVESGLNAPIVLFTAISLYAAGVHFVVARGVVRLQEQLFVKA